MTGPSVVLAYVLMAVLSLLGFIVAGLMLGYIAQLVVRHLRSRGETAEAPEELGGAHDSLPEDKATDTAFWALAKTAGIEVTS